MNAQPQTGRIGDVFTLLRRYRFIIFHVAMGMLTATLTAAVVATGSSPRVALGGWGSDHYSHVFSTVLFLSDGWDIYRKPISELCSNTPERVASSAAMALALDVNPADLCWPTSDPAVRPLVVNWQQFPRPYPPGHLLYFLPEALAYNYLGAGFETVNVLTIIKLAAVAHFAFLLVTQLLIGFRPRSLAWFLGALAYNQLMSFALAGIYDGVALLGVFLAMVLSRRSQPLPALLALSAAFFFHFRVLWLAPFGIYLALCAYHDRHEIKARLALPRKGRRGVLAAWSGVVLGIACFTCSAAAFWVLFPAMRRFPVENGLYIEGPGWPGPIAIGYFAATLALALFLAGRRRWLIVSLIAWCSLFFVWTPQTQPWHSLMLLPVLLMPALDEGVDTHVESALPLLLWFLVALSLAFRTTVRLDWLADVYARVAGG